MGTTTTEAPPQISAQEKAWMIASDRDRYLRRDTFEAIWAAATTDDQSWAGLDNALSTRLMCTQRTIR